MEINEQIVREFKKKFEVEMYKKETEIVEYWKKEIDGIYKKKYDGLSSLQMDIKALMERMNNRITILNRMAKEPKWKIFRRKKRNCQSDVPYADALFILF